MVILKHQLKRNFNEILFVYFYEWIFYLDQYASQLFPVKGPSDRIGRLEALESNSKYMVTVSLLSDVDESKQSDKIYVSTTTAGKEFPKRPYNESKTISLKCHRELCAFQEKFWNIYIISSCKMYLG